MWVDPADLERIGQGTVGLSPAPDGIAILKSQHRATALTSSHLVRGTVHVHGGAELDAFLTAADPPPMVMTDANVSWLTDRSVSRPLAFVLLNRRRLVATSAG